MLLQYNMTKKFEVITQEDENGDIIIPIPQTLLDELGWVEGDQIDFSFDTEGRIIVKRI